MKKLTTLPLVLFIVALLAGCGGLPQETPALTGAGENQAAVVESGENGIAPASHVTAPLAQIEPETAVSGDIVTSQTYINLYNQVNPSVVNIQVVGPAISSQFRETIPFPNIPGHEDIPEGFREFFENLPEDAEPDTQPEGENPFPQIPSEGQGSGFVYDTQGHIVTNNHVVQGALQITVIFADGTEAEATLVGADPGSDLAVIRVDVDPAKLRPVVMGDSEGLQVGQLVATIGNPYGLDGSMSTGIVAGLGRRLPGATAPGGGRFNIPSIIQTDAVINPGNSGGPLLNLAGEVIGVNTAIQTDPSSFSLAPSFGGVGYAVPAAIVSRVAPQLIENGQVEHAWLGVSGGTLTASLAAAMNLEAGQRGVLVQEVLTNGPAAKAGLRGSSRTTSLGGFDVPIGGDVIVQIDDQVVNRFEDLLGYIVTRAGAGQEVTVKIIRDGQLMEVTVTLEARPSTP